MDQNGASLSDDPFVASLALGEAIHLSRPDVIGALIRKHGAGLASEPLSSDIKDAEKGDTALHLACRLGKVDAIRTLLRSGVAVHLKNGAGMLALSLAPGGAIKQQIEQCFFAELLQNVCAGHTARIEKLLQSGLDATMTDGSRDESTLLHWAAAFGQGREVISLLVSAGAKVNARNNVGGTPVHEASANGAIEALEALKTAGADFSLKDARGRTPREVAQNDEVAAFLDSFLSSEMVPSSSSAQISTPSKPQVSVAKLLPTPSTVRVPTQFSSDRGISRASSPIPSDPTQALEKSMKRKIEEQEALLDSLRSTIDGLLSEHGVQEYVQRLQDHVGALTRQLAATAEQRDKLQNLYVASDRELERLARELALAKAMSPVLTTSKQAAPRNHENGSSTLNLSLQEEVDELREKCSQLTEELERERKEGYAAARMHLTYEADLRAEIKALQEQMLTNEMGQAIHNNGGGMNSSESKGLLSSLLPW